jgi:predicted O-methyltransferase YrrM
MSSQWIEVDTYFEDTLLGADPVMQAVIDGNRAAGLPAIDVSATQGKFLSLLVKMTGAQRVLEIGTLGGYSSLWMARALPEQGRLITLEAAPKHAETARRNFARAGMEGRIELRLGPAADSLKQMIADGEGPFDLIFIDADKPGNPVYIEAGLALSRPGTVMVCDNVVRGGAVIDEASADATVTGSRAAIALFGDRARFEATAVQTVGTKGYDGFAIAIVR